MDRFFSRGLIVCGSLLLAASLPGIIGARELRRMYLDGGTDARSVWFAVAGSVLILAGIVGCLRASKRSRCPER